MTRTASIEISDAIDGLNACRGLLFAAEGAAQFMDLSSIPGLLDNLRDAAAQVDSARADVNADLGSWGEVATAAGCALQAAQRQADAHAPSYGPRRLAFVVTALVSAARAQLALLPPTSDPRKGEDADGLMVYVLTDLSGRRYPVPYCAIDYVRAAARIGLSD